jgi:competence protein ComEC
LIILCIDPWQIHSLGFQLSYSVVTSILLFGLPLNRWAQSKCKFYAYLPRENWTLAHKVAAQLFSIFIMLWAISFSAWLGSLAICLEVFGYVSTSGILANIVLIQIASLVILTGISSLILGLLHLNNVSEFTNHAAWLLLNFIDTVLIFLQAVPFPLFESDLKEDFPAIFVMLPYFGILFLWHYFPRLLKGHTIWIPPLVIILSTCFFLFLQ